MGIGMSGCGLGLMNAFVGRIAPEQRRMSWLGITAAAGSMGQFVFVPFNQAMITEFDWRNAMIVMAVSLFIAVPIALSMRAGSAEGFAKRTKQSLGEALREAQAIAATMSTWIESNQGTERAKRSRKTANKRPRSKAPNKRA
jgi:MFS family permease